MPVTGRLGCPLAARPLAVPPWSPSDFISPPHLVRPVPAPASCAVIMSADCAPFAPSWTLRCVSGWPCNVPAGTRSAWRERVRDAELWSKWQSLPYNVSDPVSHRSLCDNPPPSLVLHALILPPSTRSRSSRAWRWFWSACRMVLYVCAAMPVSGLADRCDLFSIVTGPVDQHGDLSHWSCVGQQAMCTASVIATAIRPTRGFGTQREHGAPRCRLCRESGSRRR